VVQFLIENHKEVFEGVEEERAQFRERIQGEHKAKQLEQIASRAEERKAIKARRMQDERERAGILSFFIFFFFCIYGRSPLIVYFIIFTYIFT
jgi:hypothetical protein